MSSRWKSRSCWNAVPAQSTETVNQRLISGSWTLIQHHTETWALSFFPSKQAAVETLNWFNSQLVSCRKWSHPPFLPKQTICISGQTGTGVTEFLLLLPLLSLRDDIPQLGWGWSWCPTPGTSVPPAHSCRPILSPEEQLQWVKKHFMMFPAYPPVHVAKGQPEVLCEICHVVGILKAA